MRSNLAIFAVTHLLLILLLSVFFVALNLSPQLEELVFSYWILRIIPVLFAIAAYAFSGKLMSHKNLIDSLVAFIVPAVFWGALIAAAYIGGGSEAFMRGPFRSLWRFPADVAMLPQMATLGLLNISYDIKTTAALAIVPQGIATMANWVSLVRYKLKTSQRRRKQS